MSRVAATVQDGLFADSYPEPIKRHGRIYIGTSGYSFPDWTGVFYPPRLPKNEWLSYYSLEFPAIEINATYYRLPPASTFAGMARRTPPEYPFWVKLPGEATHGDNALDGVMLGFLEAIKPLHESGRLVGVLAQFPNSFRPVPRSLDKIRRLKELCATTELAVEFRRDDWQRPEIFGLLQSEGLVSVIVDLPKIAGLPVTHELVTSGIGYIRFHGRNSAAWYDPAKGDRYDYEYSLEELKLFAELALRVDEKANATFIFFNNCHMGQAVKNARMLRELLGHQFNNQQPV